jgi:hypothetical protein
MIFRILFIAVIIIMLLIYITTIKEEFTQQQVEIVVARYNENMEWIKNEPFNASSYIVYNKGSNSDFAKTDKFKEEIKLDNVGRETHSYLTHIINNYDNKSLADITVFLPGSVELSHKYDKASRLMNKILETSSNSDAFACTLSDEPVFDELKDFKIDNSMSSNENNRKINTDASIQISDIRPYGEWYKSTFSNKNIDSKCVTYNSIFGITRETILKNPKSYYEELNNQVNTHHNPETGHFFERAWPSVFYQSENTVEFV